MKRFAVAALLAAFAGQLLAQQSCKPLTPITSAISPIRYTGGGWGGTADHDACLTATPEATCNCFRSKIEPLYPDNKFRSTVNGSGQKHYCLIERSAPIDHGAWGGVGNIPILQSYKCPNGFDPIQDAKCQSQFIEAEDRANYVMRNPNGTIKSVTTAEGERYEVLSYQNEALPYMVETPQGKIALTWNEKNQLQFWWMLGEQQEWSMYYYDANSNLDRMYVFPSDGSGGFVDVITDAAGKTTYNVAGVEVIDGSVGTAAARSAGPVGRLPLIMWKYEAPPSALPTTDPYVLMRRSQVGQPGRVVYPIGATIIPLFLSRIIDYCIHAVPTDDSDREARQKACREKAKDDYYNALNICGRRYHMDRPKDDDPNTPQPDPVGYQACIKEAWNAHVEQTKACENIE